MGIDSQRQPGQCGWLRLAWEHWALAPVLAAVAVFALALASRKGLWADEIMTLHLARAGSLGELWHLLATGPQSAPPLFYLTAKAAMALFGDNPVAFRLPSLIGILLMCVSVYGFVARRCPAAYARVALLCALSPPTFAYLCEARPYGLWLGWSGLGLLCWQAACSPAGRYRRAALFGMALCSAASVSTHYYAVLVLTALGLGEIVRGWYSRRVDVWVWLALAAGLPPLLALRPLIANAQSFITGSWAAPSWGDLYESYRTMLSCGCLGVVLAIVVLLALQRHLPGLSGPEDIPPVPGFPPHELAAALAVAAVPAFGIVLAKAYTNNYQTRYTLPAVLGLAVLVAAAGCQAGRRQRWPGHLLTLVLGVALLGVGMHALVQVPDPDRPPNGPLLHEASERARSVRLPLVTSDPYALVEGHYYYPDSPLTFVCSNRFDNINEIARRLRAWHGNIIEVAQLGALGRFVLVPAMQPDRKLEVALRDMGARFELLTPLKGNQTVYLVDLTGPKGWISQGPKGGRESPAVALGLGGCAVKGAPAVDRKSCALR